MDQDNFEDDNKKQWMEDNNLTQEAAKKIMEKFQITPTNEMTFTEPKGDAERAYAVDQIIHQLSSVKTGKWGQPVKLDQKAIKFLIEEATKAIGKQPMLLELEAPIKIFGDVHGQFYDLFRLFDYAGWPSNDNKFLFIGDYVDRGKQSLETICILMAYKIKYSNTFFLLRGNHESQQINRMYGFYDECKRRYSVKLWREFEKAFNMMPFSAIIDDRILCMHGGLSPNLNDLQVINHQQRPLDVPDQGLMCDLVWSDPEIDIQGWGDNDRGVSYVFGPDIIKKFNRRHNINLICRAHQVVEDGYEFMANRGLITLFSAPNYCGEFDNNAGILNVDETLCCSFDILKPVERKILKKIQKEKAQNIQDNKNH